MDRNDHNKVCSRQGVFCTRQEQTKVWKIYFPPFTLPPEAPNLKGLRQEYSKKSCLPMSGSGLGFSHTEERGSSVFQFSQRRKWKFGASKLGIHSALSLPIRSSRHHSYKLCAVLSYPTVCNPMDCSLPSFSVHGNSLGKNTGMGCHPLLQGIFPTQGLNGIKPRSPALQVGSLPTELPEKPGKFAYWTAFHNHAEKMN